MPENAKPSRPHLPGRRVRKLARIAASSSRKPPDPKVFHQAVRVALEAIRAANCKPLEQRPCHRRKRGRPPGSGRLRERAMVQAALEAIADAPLPLYRNEASTHGMSGCDAIARAMRSAGFRSLATYDAVAWEVKAVMRVSRAHNEEWQSMAQQYRAFRRGPLSSFTALDRLRSAFCGRLTVAAYTVESSMDEERKRFGQRVTEPSRIVINDQGIVEQPEEFAGLSQDQIDTYEKRVAIMRKRATQAQAPRR